VADTLTLDLALLLPDVPDQRDACVGRLIDSLHGAGVAQAHVLRGDGAAQLCLHYDPQRFDVEALRRLARGAGARLSARYRHQSLHVTGMDSAACAGIIENALGAMDGVLEATVSYAAERLRLEYDAQRTSEAAIGKRLQALGYGVPDEAHAHDHDEHRELWVSGLAGVLLLAGWLTERLGGPPGVVIPLLLTSALAGGGLTARDAWQGLRAGRFEVDTLMLLAALGAASLGAYAEGALLLFLFSLGHALEHMAMGRARHAILALGKLMPTTARVRRDGREQELPVAELLRGDRVIVPPGQRIPADGTVIEGQSAVDQSPITGESVPVDKAPQDGVFAGTVNGDGGLTIEVTRLAVDSTLSRMLRLVLEAQARKSPTERLAQRVEKVFVPLVLIAVALLIGLPPLFGVPFGEAFYRAMAVLVAGSPCALAIATPSVMLAGMARAARGGVLIKGGAHLENLGRLRVVAFDKTGTLTAGQPRLTDVRALGMSDDALLRLAAAVETHSAHPLARAVVAAARERGLDLPDASGVQAVTGRGIRAQCAGSEVQIGHASMFGTEPMDAAVTAAVDSLEAAGRTVMLVRVDGRWAGVLGLLDTPRPGAAAALQALARLGIERTVMLTGDHARAAAAVALQLGVTDVRAGLLPQDKLAAIDALATDPGQVAMVGDGVNDAPALARATVGIAMGGAGSDAALEAADVALMGDDLGRLAFAVALGRAARRAIRQNLVIALGTVALLAPAAAAGWAGIGLAVILHEGSTLLVVLNGLRLLALADRQTRAT